MFLGAYLMKREQGFAGRYCKKPTKLVWPNLSELVDLRADALCRFLIVIYSKCTIYEHKIFPV